MKGIKILLLGISIILFSIAYAVFMGQYYMNNFFATIIMILPMVGLIVCIIGCFCMNEENK